MHNEQVEPSSITQLLRQWADGSDNARSELIPLVYHDLKMISRRVLRGEHHSTVTATGLVHDLYLKLATCDSMEWSDRRHFFAFCARIMRQILTDNARQRLARKRSAILVPLGAAEVPWIGEKPGDFLHLDGALKKLEELEPAKAKVVELRIYLGCTSTETAEILGIGKATVDRHMTFAKAWLYRYLKQSDKSAAP